MAKQRLYTKIINSGPLALLYFFSISELDANIEGYFDILSFNLQLIIIYFWAIKRPEVLGNGHVFFTGFINDVVMGMPLGLSSLSYLVVCLVANYIKNMTVNTTFASDCFTFLIAVIFSNITFVILTSNFTELPITLIEISYNTFFTLIFFPFFWFLFSFYNSIIIVGKNA